MIQNKLFLHRLKKIKFYAFSFLLCTGLFDVGIAYAKNASSFNNQQDIAQNPISLSTLSPKKAYEKSINVSKKTTDETSDTLRKILNYIEYSASAGYAQAQFKLGLIYFQGIGVSSNSEIGFFWIQKAAKNNCPEAQIYLAYMYKQGIGTSVDLFKSSYWLRKARANGINFNLDTLTISNLPTMMNVRTS